MKKRDKPKILITERDKVQIEGMAGIGLTLNNIALILNVAPNALEAWIDDPKIQSFYEKGRLSAEVEIAQTLFERAKDGDLGAIAWWEATRSERSDQVEKQ